ncbi:MAG: hypothetical protein GX556_06505 [Fibrobacter sp.]|nr:hypothetical protein [Fibrobacter sp.]
MPKYNNPLPEGLNRRDYQTFLYRIERTGERLRDRDKYSAKREQLPSGEFGIGLYKGTACLGKWFMTLGAVQGDRQNKRAFWNVFKKCQDYEEVYDLVSKYCFYWECQYEEYWRKCRDLQNQYNAVEKDLGHCKTDLNYYKEQYDNEFKMNRKDSNRYLNLLEEYTDLLGKYRALKKEKTDNLSKAVSKEQEPEKEETTAPDCEPGSIEAMCRKLSEDRTGRFTYSKLDVTRNIDLLIINSGMIPGRGCKAQGTEGQK